MLGETQGSLSQLNFGINHLGKPSVTWQAVVIVKTGAKAGRLSRLLFTNAPPGLAIRLSESSVMEMLYII